MCVRVRNITINRYKEHVAMAVCFAQLLSVAKGLVSLSSQHVQKNPSVSLWLGPIELMIIFDKFMSLIAGYAALACVISCGRLTNVTKKV